MTGLIDPAQTSTVGKMLYAEYLLYGKVVNTGNGYRISTSITETNTGKVYRTEYEDVRSQNGIPLAARTLSYKLLDRQFQAVEPESGLDGGDYASIYSDAKEFTGVEWCTLR